MRISDWSSDVCSSDLAFPHAPGIDHDGARQHALQRPASGKSGDFARLLWAGSHKDVWRLPRRPRSIQVRSEEHTSELQSLMRYSYAVFCLKNKKEKTHNRKH